MLTQLINVYLFLEHLFLCRLYTADVLANRSVSQIEIGSFYRLMLGMLLIVSAAHDV